MVVERDGSTGQTALPLFGQFVEPLGDMGPTEVAGGSGLDPSPRGNNVRYN